MTSRTSPHNGLENAEAVVQDLPLPIAIVRAGKDACEVLAINGAFSRLFDVPKDRARGEDLRSYFSWDEQARGLGLSGGLSDQPQQLRAAARSALAGSAPLVLTVTPYGDSHDLRLVAAREVNVGPLPAVPQAAQTGTHRLTHDSSETVFLLDAHGTMTDVHPAGASWLGYTREQVEGSHYTNLMHPDDLPRVRAAFEGALNGNVERLETRMFTKARDVILVEVLARPSVKDGVVTGVYGRAHDITERRDIEQRLEQSEQSYRALYDDNIDAVATISFDGTVLYANPTVAAMMGYAREEVEGISFLPFIVPDLRDYTAAKFASAMDGRTVQYETAMYNSRQEVVDLHITLIPIVIDGGVPAVHCIGKDITESKRLRKQLHDMAYRDPVTGLPNANSLGVALEAALTPAGSFDVLLIDIDRLKVVNDTWGRAVGDRLLAAIGQRLEGLVQESGQLFRHTEDDFVMLHMRADADDCVARATELEDALRAPFLIDDVPIRVTASIGISSYPKHGFTAEDLLRNAEKALRSARKSGQRHVAIYRGLDQLADARALRMELALRSAIENGELSLVYQPQMNLCSGELHGVEALLRWQHPEAGAVSPEEFIPLAERTGMIHEIGMWVIDEVFRQSAQWQQDGTGEIPVSINISVDQFFDVEFAHQLERAIDTAGITPSTLTLEITETVSSQSDVVVDQLHRFAGIGVCIAIDDFGTGYSSLRYLQEFPVDYLKIDRSFIDQSETSKRDRDLIATIVSLAKNFGLKTIAEGVETVGQLEFLRSLETEFAQGYHFARPMPPDALRSWLAERE